MFIRGFGLLKNKRNENYLFFLPLDAVAILIIATAIRTIVNSISAKAKCVTGKIIPAMLNLTANIFPLAEKAFITGTTASATKALASLIVDNPSATAIVRPAMLYSFKASEFFLQTPFFIFLLLSLKVGPRGFEPRPAGASLRVGGNAVSPLSGVLAPPSFAFKWYAGGLLYCASQSFFLLKEKKVIAPKVFSVITANFCGSLAPVWLFLVFFLAKSSFFSTSPF